MKIALESQYQPLVDAFFRHNPSLRHTVGRDGDRIVLEIEVGHLPEQARRQIRYHFKYLPLFTWAGSDLDDVIFWERAELFGEIVADFATITVDLAFERLVALEARGFLLAGILGQGVGLPVYAVRKDKPSYRRFPGRQIPIINWKGTQETLFLFEKRYLNDSTVLVVDDVIETGNSLEATMKGLAALGAMVEGAFYLCDVMEPARRAGFSIPIRAFVQPATATTHY